MSTMPHLLRGARVTCTHRQPLWVPDLIDDWSGEVVEPGHYESESTTEDLDVGRFRCTQCGEIMYYTGSWKAYWEEGKPCPGSELVSKYDKGPPPKR